MNDIDRQNKKLKQFLQKYYSGYYDDIYIQNKIMYFENKSKKRKNCVNVSYLTTTDISSRLVL